MGLSFSASAVIQINTTGPPAVLGSSTIDPGFRLSLTGDVKFLGFA